MFCLVGFWWQLQKKVNIKSFSHEAKALAPTKYVKYYLPTSDFE